MIHKPTDKSGAINNSIRVPSSRNQQFNNRIIDRNIYLDNIPHLPINNNNIPHLSNYNPNNILFNPPNIPHLSFNNNIPQNSINNHNIPRNILNYNIPHLPKNNNIENNNSNNNIAPFYNNNNQPGNCLNNRISKVQSLYKSENKSSKITEITLINPCFENQLQNNSKIMQFPSNPSNCTFPFEQCQIDMEKQIDSTDFKIFTCSLLQSLYLECLKIFVKTTSSHYNKLFNIENLQLFPFPMQCTPSLINDLSTEAHLTYSLPSNLQSFCSQIEFPIYLLEFIPEFRSILLCSFSSKESTLHKQNKLFEVTHSDLINQRSFLYSSLISSLNTLKQSTFFKLTI